MNKAHVIEITKACTVALMKARNSLVVHCRKKHVNWQKTKDGENLFFKAIANRFWLRSKSYTWFNKVVHGRPSFKLTSWKGKWSVTKSKLDVELVKKVTLEMITCQQMIEEGLNQNY